MLGALSAAAAAATGFLLAAAPDAMAQEVAAGEDHSRDAQIIAAAVLLAITGVLGWTRRNRWVATQNTTVTDESGDQRTIKRGWLVPPEDVERVKDADKTEKRLSHFRSLYLGKDNRASTSKAVALAWTYAIAYGLLSLLAAKLLGSPQGWDKQVKLGLQEEYLLLLGGPYAAAGIAKYAATSDETKTTDDNSSPTKDPKDLISDDEGNSDLVDFQYVLFNAVALAFFYGNFILHLLDGFPKLPSLLVGLTLTSATGYAAKKAATDAASPQLTSVFPETVAKDESFELFGRNLVSDSKPPNVSVGGIKAKGAKVLTSEGPGDRLQVDIPDAVAADTQKIKVTTLTGAKAVSSAGTDHLTITVTAKSKPETEQAHEPKVEESASGTTSSSKPQPSE